MPSDNPLDGLPVNGVFPLTLSPAFVAALAGNGKGGKEDVIGMKYAFKPESITPETEGRLDMNKGRASQLTFDTKKGTQVFDIRDEASAQRECAIIWNPETVSFTIYHLPTTLNLTLNRNLSGQPFVPPPAPAQVKRKAEPKESPKKKSRPSIAEQPKPSTSGKSLPKKSLPVPVPAGKVKSVEIIESEDEEEDDDDDGDDDFAALLGAEMAKGQDEDEGVIVDYEDSESGEEDDDFEL